MIEFMAGLAFGVGLALGFALGGSMVVGCMAYIDSRMRKWEEDRMRAEK